MFTHRDCVFMTINCVASGAEYFGLVAADSKSLEDVCPNYENVMLVVLILRLYLLPAICVFKLGLTLCEWHGDYVDVASLVVFTGLQLHYAVLQAYTKPECREFIHKNGATIMTVVVAMMLDLSRVASYFATFLSNKKKGIRINELTDRSETKMLIPQETMELDDLLAELDSDLEINH
jgi:hypothetical protein